MKENALVLIVDNQPDNLLAYTRYLEAHAPVRLVTAANGVEAVQKARRFQPDLILLGLDAPDMNGEDVITALKEIPETEEIPAVLLSGDVSEELLLQQMSGSLGEMAGAAR
jgi:two-component system, OmpR family, alkaline phosphatase synthesis response regulator PhoP